MARKATPLQYREIQFHGGNMESIGSGKYAIRMPDGTVVKRKDGSGVRSFNGKILARDAARFGSVCRYCGEMHDVLTVDHVIAWSLVGDYENAANVAACCDGCNKKYNKFAKPEGLMRRILRENREMAGRIGPAIH